jgi:hypothetical protein
VDVEATPPQPDEVTRAIAAALAPGPRGPDPWWQAGVNEAADE